MFNNPMVSIIENIKKFSTYKIAVVGDVMVDHNISGNVQRISPEAPIPIVDVSKQQHLPGGAANVAYNISSLGATAYLVGVIGKDDNGQLLKKNMEKKSIDPSYLIEDSSRPTTTKMRIFSQNYQFIRADIEKKNYISKDIENLIYKQILSFIKNIDALVFQDYNKGLLTHSLIKKIIALCKENNIITAVDPKKDNFFEYQYVNFFKPNKKEILDAFNSLDFSLENIKKLGHQLIKKLKSQHILITLSEEGMIILDEHQKSVHIHTEAKKIYDPSGAGDSVISTFILAYLATNDIELALKLSNISASINCQKIGVSPTSKEELISHLHLLK